MDSIYSSRPDLQDEPLKNPDIEYFTDGSSFVREGQRRAGYSVVTLTDVIEAQPLPVSSSAQKAELVALTRALQLAAGCSVNIYTDSKFAFLTLHAHGALWKERGLIGAEGKALKYGPELETLLEAVWAPRKVAVIHCRGHSKGTTKAAKGNQLADLAAKRAALLPPPPASITASLLPTAVDLEQIKPIYTEAEQEWAQQEGGYRMPPQDGWFILPDQRIFVPEALGRNIVKQYHESTHYGATALRESLNRQFYITRISQLAEAVSRACLLCAKNNPKQGPVPPPGIQQTGLMPMENLIVDFTEMPKAKGYKALLVFTCSLTGGVSNAFPSGLSDTSTVLFGQETEFGFEIGKRTADSSVERSLHGSAGHTNCGESCGSYPVDSSFSSEAVGGSLEL
uniref:uncharacterized protein LOC114589762 n=1 Tax=Podarcis muralis TaxID=64176 RepID=UPI0010A0138A|nr:uncharacterized protein LOC114589762 [Podarcis muralis]